ncbi:translation initiation factor IF-3 [Aminipila butyrica]|uniref:Translation initiation factor IF-3 n=1 Tax=Aminipila butyrica TaxID=433296 RepID=A0A858C229_9FIRM|nr:translation initiation factor IF-3 [Aminipila butyrica]
MRINEEINNNEIRLVDTDGTMLGIVPVSEALKLASDKDLDLVEISPNAVPPVCKIIDYNKNIYEQAKKEKEAKKNQKTVTLKEVRISAGIGDHDLEVKSKNAQKFLLQGNKIKVSLRFKGRQQKYATDGLEVFSRFAESVKEVGVVEKNATLEGRIMTMIIGPKNI